MFWLHLLLYSAVTSVTNFFCMVISTPLSANVFDTKTSSNSECYCTLQWFDALLLHFLFNPLFCIVNDSMHFSASSMMQCILPRHHWFNALFRVVTDSMHSSWHQWFTALPRHQWFNAIFHDTIHFCIWLVDYKFMFWERQHVQKAPVCHRMTW